MGYDLTEQRPTIHDLILKTVSIFMVKKKKREPHTKYLHVKEYSVNSTSIPHTIPSVSAACLISFGLSLKNGRLKFP